MSQQDGQLGTPKRAQTCALCGATVPLMRAHVFAGRSAGSVTKQDTILVCANCNAQLDQGTLREFEFVQVLSALMRQSGTYAEVLLEPDVSTGKQHTLLRPDMLARTGHGRTVLIECKSVLTIAANRLHEAIAQIDMYREHVHVDEAVLALPARLTSSQRDDVIRAGIQAWDLDEIAGRFKPYLDSVAHPLLRAMLRSASALSEPTSTVPAEAALLAELKSVPAGRPSWAVYQKLVVRIFERLFCPPLSTPITELPDDAGANRRDLILPNYSDHGFWAFVRGRYCADYIVVDAKNFTATVGKAEALQILNYLKRHGAGLLGFVVSRHGADESFLHTVREHWAQEGKLIVSLSDEHVERMLKIKEAGGPPEDVIRQWIEDFRLSL